VLIHKGRTKALRELASELEDYRNSIPASTLTEMRRPDAPVSDITQESITNMIREAAKTTTTTYGIEDALANISYSRNITLARYYDPENILKFNEISPTIININGTDTPVRYENANPYLTNLTKSQIENIKQPLFLSDGREILYQRKAQAGGVERVSFGFNG
jgi:Glu-tRNA(Gln) amidotransferase subunit E-like FAD-binding protein